MEQFGSEEARRNFRRILNDVERGDHVGVHRYSKPLAIVVPAEWYEKAKAALAATGEGK